MGNNQSHVASLTAQVNAIYLTSINERVTVGCFFEHQLIAPSFSMKMKFGVDFRLCLSTAESESQYPSM